MRKFAVFVGTSALSFLLFSTALTAVIVLTFTPAHVKSWLSQSNVYDTVINSLAKQGQTAIAKNSNSQVSPEVQAAIKKAVTPEFLQNSTNQFIDGVTPWLEGKSAKPTFNIDVSGPKLIFIQSLADTARTRYASLPVCAKGQIPDISDVLNISCRVPGVSIEPQIQKAISDFSDNKDFLPNPVITADNLNTNNNGTQRPIFDQLKDAPVYYHWIRIAPFIFGALALIAALVVILGSTKRRHGIRRVTLTLGLVGIMLLVSTWLTTFGMNKADAQLTKSVSNNSVVQHSSLTLLKTVQHDLNKNILIFGVAFLAIGAGLLVYLLLTRPYKGSKPAAPQTKDTPEPAPETPEEPKRPTKPPVLVQSLL